MLRILVCAAYLATAGSFLGGCVPSESPNEAGASTTPRQVTAPAPAPPAASPPPPAPAPTPTPALPIEEATAPSPSPEPTAPPEEPVLPNEAAAEIGASTAEPQDEKQHTVTITGLDPVPGGMNASAEVSRVEDKLEYVVSGTFGLAGTISKSDPENPEWHFLGTLTFPTSGYKLGELYSNGTPGTESTVIIFVPIGLPPVNAPLVEEPVTQSFDFRFPAGNGASFVVLFANL